MLIPRRMQSGQAWIVAGRFEILELAEVGGSGKLFRARDQRIGALVAIKLAGDEPRLQAQLEAEAAALREIRVPGVPRLIASGRAGGMPYLITEWREGRSLRALLREEVSAARAFAIATKLLAVVGELHTHGWAHGDLTPASIVVRGAGAELTVSLVDLGLARRLLGGEATVAGDLHAVGEALSALLACDPAAAPVVRRAMHADPRKRFDSALAMRHAIETAMLAGGSGVTRRPSDLGAYSISLSPARMSAARCRS